MKHMHPLFLLVSLVLSACGGSDEMTTDAEIQTSEESTTVFGEATTGLDIGLFLDGALDEEATIQNCTLADGTETTCYAITVAGFPVDSDVGPFCPETTATDAEDAGIWFDGNELYDADGEFILGLAELYNDSNWKLYNDDGSVRITDTPEAFEAAARPEVDPAYQNHCVEGRMEWLENGEPVPTTVMIPTAPVVAESATPARGNLGVTLNGVVIAAPAPVDAILGAYTIAAFDDCGGHINPIDGYHLHGARGCSEVGEAADGETPIFAYAMDGYAIHSPLSEEAAAAADLDECNGHTSDELGYHYHAAPAEDNGILTCLKGVTVEGTARGPGPRPGGGPGNGAPNFSEAADQLGVSVDELTAALGEPPFDLEAAAKELNVTVEELREALPLPPAQPLG